uniref:Uncharacterized protein n=1 Tax=Panagrolaimus davidi TaxID=227884 RepID=A0A914P4W4_9BILA
MNKNFLLFCFYSSILYSSATNFAFPTKKIQCPCPRGLNEECTPQVICVYGINDVGEIFHNGKNDTMDLTKIALQRREEIGNNNDDVLVNLYNPYFRTMAIFYYGCRKCDDLLNYGGNITVSKLTKFLLSIYNQRMKYNIKYSQSDFVYYENSSSNELQPMPEINVRPFWKNRLMLNQTCAHKKQNFTQKHFIPAFLTQDLCVLDYKMTQYIKNGQMINSSHTNNGEIIYSLTLSNSDLYIYNVIINSTKELPAEFQAEQEMCKFTFYLEANRRQMRFFCLCKTQSCTLKIQQKDPTKVCPYALSDIVYSARIYQSMFYETAYMNVEKFFFQDNDNGDEVCAFVWRTQNTTYDAIVAIKSAPVGYTFESEHPEPEGPWFCKDDYYSITQLAPLHAIYHTKNATELPNVVLKTILDHSQIIGDIRPVGANCSSEGPLSDPFFSSSYGSNSSMFPCYEYYDIFTMEPVYPLMGINLMPIKLYKGKYCYYYTVILHANHIRACSYGSDAALALVGCPENMTVNETELERMQEIVSACPTMKSNETQWKYEAPFPGKEIFCGQFLRGLKLQNGKYVPNEIELRSIDHKDFYMAGMWDDEEGKYVSHGCGFNSTQNLTLCTCYAVLGGCEDLYTVGRVHLLRYLPFDNATTHI